MIDYSKKALRLHRKLRGKIEIKNKAPIKRSDDLSVYYTPGVGAVSAAIAKKKRLVSDLTFKQNSVAVISDGSAVLGLGNVGPEAALPVMEGKVMLFKQFAGIDAIPIVLATQDTEEVIKAVKAIAPTFGGINLEDISAPRCFKIERRLRDELDIPVMHDDQHATAVVVSAALLNALKLVKKKMADVRIVISGAGAAGISVTKLLLKFGARHVIVVDSIGAIYVGRPKLNPYKKELGQKTNRGRKKGKLSDILPGADVFIGVSAPRILTVRMVKTMAHHSIVFALSNPIPEIMPDQAKKGGAFIVATGRSDFPNQINNVLVFPGIFRGALDARAKSITEEMKINAAKRLAAIIKHPSRDKIIPSVFSKKVVPEVARAVKDSVD